MNKKHAQSKAIRKSKVNTVQNFRTILLQTDLNRKHKAENFTQQSSIQFVDSAKSDDTESLQDRIDCSEV